LNEEQTRLDFKLLSTSLLDKICKSGIKQKFEQAIVVKNAEPF
jgi:hypothetical protein